MAEGQVVHRDTVGRGMNLHAVQRDLASSLICVEAMLKVAGQSDLASALNINIAVALGNHKIGS
ncbi:hypothetical protein [Phyllobacterium leguminum]|uniref:hypothetical protein n=1 Tax=Phyllobacterium leguminum TaxID=314237 RepID=UPI0015E8C2CA|nr:hypothetical protein [Phyllobacterium leguminum]